MKAGLRKQMAFFEDITAWNNSLALFREIAANPQIELVQRWLDGLC